MSSPGDDSGEFHAVVSKQIEANRNSIDRLTEENRLLRDAVARLLGHGPPDDPDDELAARRRRRERRAGFIALPLGAAGALRHALTPQWAVAGVSAATLAAGGWLLAVHHGPYHPRTVPSPAASAFYPAAAPAVVTHPWSPGRQSHHPRPGKSGTAARSIKGHPSPRVSRSRAAVPPSPLVTPILSVPPLLPSPGRGHHPVPGVTHLPPPGHEHAPGWLKRQLPLPVPVRHAAAAAVRLGQMQPVRVNPRLAEHPGSRIARDMHRATQEVGHVLRPVMADVIIAELEVIDGDLAAGREALVGDVIAHHHHSQRSAATGAGSSISTSHRAADARLDIAPGLISRPFSHSS